MGQVFFTADLHFGHKNINKFREHCTSEEDNRNIIKESWDRLVSKNDLVYVLGDAVFTKETLVDIAERKGRKILIRGNHDTLSTKDYLTVFEEVYGILKYKEFWLTHAPIHPLELRGKRNIHGHVHYATIPDNAYINVSVENVRAMTGECLISLDNIRKMLCP